MIRRLDSPQARAAAQTAAAARQSTELAEPIAMVGRVLDNAPVVVEALFGGATRLTRRWVHGELHDTLPGLAVHLLVAHHGLTACGAVWRTEGQRLESRLGAGTMTVIPAGQGGRWDIFGSVEVSQVYLPDARLQSAAEPLTGGKRVALVGRPGIADPAAARVMELLSGSEDLADAGSRLFVEQAIDLLCTQLVRCHSSYGALPPAPPRRGLADWQVRKVTAYMRERLEEEIGLEELAALVSLSRFHFCSAFRLATGCTPHGWLVSERIGKARALLAQSRLPVTEIALSVGYQTPSSFAAAFRKVVGTSPTDFRRRL